MPTLNIMKLDRDKFWYLQANVLSLSDLLADTDILFYWLRELMAFI